MNTKNPIPVFVALLAILGTFCIFSIQTPEVQTAPEKTTGTLVMYLTSNSHIIGIRTHERFDVMTKDGVTLAKSITAAEFQSQYPEIYQQYRSLYAEIWAGTDSRPVAR